MSSMSMSGQARAKKQSFWKRLSLDLRRNKIVYLMALPMIAFYVIFHYIPMGGVVIAFQNFRPARGFMGSDWVGLRHFVDFFTGPFAWRVIRNTFLLNFYDIVFGFPMPIILALLLNEVRLKSFKKVVQTISYMPFFISIVVICGILADFSRSAGLFNIILGWFGREPENLLMQQHLFRRIFVGSGIWETVGWGSIIYLASISTIDPTMYEAADMDGATRLRKIWNITLPALIPIISILLIMRIGNIMTQGAEKVLLLYNPLTFETADVISTFVFRRGLEEMNFSFGAAVGLFNSVVNVTTLVVANGVFRRFAKESLW